MIASLAMCVSTKCALLVAELTQTAQSQILVLIIVAQILAVETPVDLMLNVKL
jgi:hypothetical protein